MHTQVSLIKTDGETSRKLSVPFCNTDLPREQIKRRKMIKKRKRIKTRKLQGELKRQKKIVEIFSCPVQLGSPLGKRISLVD